MNNEKSLNPVIQVYSNLDKYDDKKNEILAFILLKKITLLFRKTITKPY